MSRHHTPLVPIFLSLVRAGLIGAALGVMLIDVLLALVVALVMLCAGWGSSRIRKPRAENADASDHVGSPAERLILPNYLRDRLQSVSDAIIPTDLDFNIVTWNRAAEQLATGATTITAQVLGIARLRQTTPAIFDEMVDRFANLLELALERSVFKVEHNVTDGVRIMAERLGFVRAGPRM